MHAKKGALFVLNHDQAKCQMEETSPMQHVCAHRWAASWHLAVTFRADMDAKKGAPVYSGLLRAECQLVNVEETSLDC